MKVVHLVSYLDDQTGGMERQALQLCLKLNALGHETFFITCIHLDKMIRERIGFKGRIKGIRVYRIPIIRGARGLNSLLYLVGGFVLLLLLKKRYAIIHAHQLYTSGLVACAASLFLRSKRVIIKNCAGGSICGDIVNLIRLRFGRRLARLIQRRAERIVCVSRQTAEETAAAGFSRLMIIPNGVDTETFLPADQETKDLLRGKMGIWAGERLILFIGRLSPEKNLPVLIESMALLDRAIRLMIVGKGTCLDELRALTRQKELEDRVIFVEETEDIPDFYRMADILVLPSRSEGLPNVLLEAMSCGLVCVGSDIPGIAAVIKDGRDGFLSACGSAVSLAGNIKLALADPRRAAEISLAARASVKERFDFGIIAGAYSELYKGCHG